MLKMSSSVVLASLKACDVRKKVRLGFSLAAASLDGHFEHPEFSSFRLENAWRHR
jgi:hypothetical protein